MQKRFNKILYRRSRLYDGFSIYQLQSASEASQTTPPPPTAGEGSRVAGGKNKCSFSRYFTVKLSKFGPTDRATTNEPRSSY